MKREISRRRFLGEASCAALGSASMVSSILNLMLANRAAAAGLNPGEDCKTIVCILLAGGIDSFNLLVKRDASGYAEYSAARSNMALGSGGDAGTGGASYLTNLDQATGGDGNLYGIHPSCAGLAEMFNGTGNFAGNRRLSFVANVGTLVEPTTLTQYQNGTVAVPKALFSHIDQINQWQTSVAQGLPELTGWAGRMADVLHSTMNTQATAMSISLAGNNVYQIGNSTAQFAITKNGALTPTGNAPGLGSETARKNLAIEGMMNQTYNNLVQDAFATHIDESHDAQAAFGSHYDAITLDPAVEAYFPASNFAQELKAALKTILARSALGLRRSTIFVQRGGWDHHGELLLTQAGMLDEISQALTAFQRGLEFYGSQPGHTGIQDEVITYTSSDFGRTLRSNGRGTDHAWGGCQLVMGGPVDGGKVFGSFPSLALDGADDVGQGGRILPSTSVDEFFGEMARWFGVQPTDIPYILPNFENFVPDIAGTPYPVGYIKPGLIT